jgi:hypothetical protein
MPISNMQQARQMYEYGGLSAPRQNYGLGSFVKKAVRGVKKVAKSPLGKAALQVLWLWYTGHLLVVNGRVWYQCLQEQGILWELRWYR